MTVIYNFEKLNFSGISYGGHGGSKRGVIIDNEKWFLKYPKSTKSMKNVELSYNTAPISEYIGSKIYSDIGIETHDTKLGYANEKIVVACRDFLNNSEVIIDYNMIKNEYDENVEKSVLSLNSSSDNSNNDIEEVFVMMENNPYFKSIPELKTRFWDMFVVDAFIGNNDRNEGNWGLVLDKETNKLRIAPVFDNGAAFYNKATDDKLLNIYENEFKFNQSVYESAISVYRQNGIPINPLKYIKRMDNMECNKAILRIIPKINMENIKNIINKIPSEFNGIEVVSNVKKDFYIKSLQYKYDNVLLPVYNKLLEKNNGPITGPITGPINYEV